MAEGVFVEAARRRGVLGRFRADSCGTGDWHAGELPDARSIAAAKKRGVMLTHRARAVLPDRDFATPPDGPGFDWFIGMDRSNCRRLIALGAPTERVRLLRSFDPALRLLGESELEVPDPYTEPDEAFDEVYAMVSAASDGLLDFLLANR